MAKISIGKEVDKFSEISERLKKVRSEERKIVAELEEQKQVVFDLLDQTGQEGAKGTKVSVTIGHDEIGTIDDPEKFWNFVYRNKEGNLLQLRLSNPAFQELMKHRKGRPIPGTGMITKRKLYIHTR